MDGRELTLIRVDHPLNIDGDQWLRVDHPTLDPLTQGAPTLGWEGDPRLVVYLHGASKTFVLWRLEHDGEYRAVAALPGEITPENINRLCARLVEIDTRSGFDAGQEVLDARTPWRPPNGLPQTRWSLTSRTSCTSVSPVRIFLASISQRGRSPASEACRWQRLVGRSPRMFLGSGLSSVGARNTWLTTAIWRRLSRHSR